MEIKVLNYRIIIEPGTVGKNRVYTAFCPTLGVSDWGKTVEVALENIKEGIECHLESLAKHKEQIPEGNTSDFMIATAKIHFPKAAFN